MAPVNQFNYKKCGSLSKVTEAIEYKNHTPFVSCDSCGAKHKLFELPVKHGSPRRFEIDGLLEWLCYLMFLVRH